MNEKKSIKFLFKSMESQHEINIDQSEINKKFLEMFIKMQDLVSKDIEVLHKRIDQLERIIVKYDGMPPEPEILIKNNDFTLYEHRNQWMPFWKLKKCFKRWKKNE